MSRQNPGIEEVVVFAGARAGNEPVFARHAEEFGALLGDNNYKVCYGGGSFGLMGAVAGAARDHGSRVRGIIVPAFRNVSWYTALEGAEEETLETLNARKLTMITSTDAAVVLPGGLGSLDEYGEVLAMQDMRIYAGGDEFLQPTIVLNTEGYYDDLKNQFNKGVAKGFIGADRLRLVHFVDTPRDGVAILNAINQKGRMRAADFL